MDELFRDKFRAVGAATVLIIAVFFIVLLFVQQREKKNISFKLKVFMTDITQSLLISKNNNGLPGDWGLKPGYKNAGILYNNFFKYLKISEDCINTSGNCFIDGNYKSIKQKETTFNVHKLPAVKMQNGISIAVETISTCRKANEICSIIYVDLNNIEEPNAFGKDMFVFSIINDDTSPIKPYNPILPEDILRDNHKYGCKEQMLEMWRR